MKIEFPDEFDLLGDWVPLPEDAPIESYFLEGEWENYLSFYEEVKKEQIGDHVQRPPKRAIEKIAAAKGDDYASVSNLFEWGIAYLHGHMQQGLKISWKDVNFSQHSLFYAESLIMIPASAYLHWEYTLRRAKGTDIPFLLDPVHLKSLTPVRKQQSLETDLPSKMELLATRARWCDEDAPSYDFHQHA
jgi:hypothetical protein